MKKAKLTEIEILRGVAFLAVVMQHVIAGVFYQPDLSSSSIIIGTTFLGLTRFAVPLFVFITGVVLFYNYDAKLNYKSFLRKRFKQIVIPYLAWTFFYYVWVSFLSGVGASTTWNELLKILKLSLTGHASYHLWFMVMIIPFYLLFPLFRFLLSKDRKVSTNLIVVAAFLAVNLILVYALSKGWITSDNPFLNLAVLPYLDRNFLFWLFYFVLGGLVGLYYEQWKTFVHRTWLISLVILGACLYVIYSKIAEIHLNRASDLYLYSANVTAPLKPFMMLTIIVLIILVFALARLLADKTTKFTNLLGIFGRYSFGTYLIHALVLSFTNHFATSYLGMLDVYSQTVISFVLCASISLFLCVWISRMKMTVGEMMVGRV